MRQESNKFKVEWSGYTLKERTPIGYEIQTETWQLEALRANTASISSEPASRIAWVSPLKISN